MWRPMYKKNLLFIIVIIIIKKILLLLVLEIIMSILFKMIYLFLIVFDDNHLNFQNGIESIFFSV